MAKKSLVEGEECVCPYCNRRGMLHSISPEGLFVIHELKWMDVVSGATGKKIPAEVLYDACRQGTKVGRRYAESTSASAETSSV